MPWIQHGNSCRIITLLAIATAFLPVAASRASASAGHAYAVNQQEGSVSIIDADRYTVIKTIRGVGSLPRAVATVSGRGKAYVANYGASSEDVAVIDIDPGSDDFATVVDRVALPSESPPIAPSGVAATADGTRVYVAAYRSVFVIDTATDEVIAEVGGLDSADRLAITPDDSEVYVTNYYGHSLTVIANVPDPAAIGVTAEIPMHDGVGHVTNPRDLAVTPDGRLVYVTDVTSRVLTVVDTASKRIVRLRHMPSVGSAVAFSSDGKKAYVGGLFPYTMMALRTDTDTVTSMALLPPLSYPVGMDLTADGKRLFVADYVAGSWFDEGENDGRVIVLDAARNRTIGVIETGAGTEDVELAR